jgi:hypothetical protein
MSTVPRPRPSRISFCSAFVRKRRGNEDGHLLPVHGGPERGAHRHLGLSEPGVAADQAVHRLAVAHVEVDILDRLDLIGRLLEFEGGAELLVKLVWRSKGLPVHHLPRGVDRNQLFGHLPDRFFHPLLEGFPGTSAQPVHLRDKAVRPDIPLDLIDSVHGDIETILVLVLDQEKIVLDPAYAELLESPVPSDPMLRMDDEVPFLELPEGP